MLDRSISNITRCLTLRPKDFRLAAVAFTGIRDTCTSMQIFEWGNSLAVRLPAAVVEALKLKEGDEIEISIAGQHQLEVARDRSREKAIEELRRLARPLPAGFMFNREELNER